MPQIISTVALNFAINKREGGICHKKSATVLRPSLPVGGRARIALCKQQILDGDICTLVYIQATHTVSSIEREAGPINS
jgi:hypothetical protein